MLMAAAPASSWRIGACSPTGTWSPIVPRVVARDAAGTRLPAKLMVADRARDLALLSVEKPAGPPLTFRDGPAVRRGESVITYGFPLSGCSRPGRR